MSFTTTEPADARDGQNDRILSAISSMTGSGTDGLL